MKLPKIFPVACHTDNIGPGTTFVAIKGMKEDGIKYIRSAIKKGATKIIVSDDAKLDHTTIHYIKKQNIKLVRSKNPRQTLAQLSAQAFNYPAKKLKIIGVTGTKGKTTTCFLLEHLLHTAGFKTALLSTVYNKIDNTIFKTSLTTQHPDYLHVFFDQCVKNKIDFVVMEVAAQALSLERVYGLTFDGVIFTNFDQEHAEFYDSMNDYFAAKCKIFKQAKKNTPIFINADDTWCQKIFNFLKADALTLRQAPAVAMAMARRQDERSENCAQPFKNSLSVMLSEIKRRVEAYSFSLKNGQIDYHAQILKNNITGLKLKINKESFVCPSLFGEFNAYNILAAVALLKKLGLSSKSIQQGLIQFQGVPGRLQIHRLPNGAQACIDKAHNPSSYQAILSTLRLLTEYLIVVFGCGGERDKTKRPIMGKIAAEFGDLVIVTSDDPRSENPEEIIEDILVGIDEKDYKKVIKEIDREQAIKIAYKHSRPTSIIALLGKGPEEYQLVNGVKHYFSEQSILQEL